MVDRRLWERGAASLAELHPVLARCFQQHGALTPKRSTKVADRFESLASSIAYQQLTGRAASTIWARVVDAVPGPFTPSNVLATDPESLRRAGLSSAKTASLIDLAASVDCRQLRLDRVGWMRDDEIVDHLTQVRGIGPWTAQMFLIFDLGRVDVWPIGDLGVRKGYSQLFGTESPPTAAELDVLGTPFSPFRSVLAQWCWRAADGTDSEWL
ncbi:MAG: DNA-3-methyladenine glycosylase family protein [Actinomycetes bacterium]